MKLQNWFKSGSAARRPAAQLRLDGDRARDKRNWASSIAAYQRYLEKSPEDIAIWIQLGHSLKEFGRHDDALSAYTRGVELDPHNEDSLLHYTHLRDRIAAESVELDGPIDKSVQARIKILRRLQVKRTLHPVGKSAEVIDRSNIADRLRQI